MKHDLLHIQGKPYVLVPLHEYRMMTNGAQAEGQAAPLPDDVLDALTGGQDTPLKILRRHRGLTQQELARNAGISRPYLTEIERGRKEGSVSAIRALATALSVPADLLLRA